MSGSELLRRLRWLVFHSWNIPPVFGLGFILMIGVLQPSQVAGILTTPLEPAYILGWLVFSMWFLPRQMRPLADWLDGGAAGKPEAALRAVRRFPLVFWTTFLIYLAVAPASVIVAAEIYTGFAATPYDWFRIELVALIVSIIVGLPIFFLIFDLFGQALGAMKLSRPIVSIRTKVFLIGALVPLLIDTMLVQYYWTRTGYFTFETFGVWLLLEGLAIGGSLIFAHSFGQSLGPLQALTGAAHPLPEGRIAALRARSTDEIGVLTADYRILLEEQRLQGEILELNNRLLRSAGGDVGTAAVFRQVVDLCRQAVNAGQAFVLIFDTATNELVGVAQSGSDYRPEGHYRLRLDEPSLAAWAFNQGRSVAVEDARNDPRVSPRMSEHFNVRSAIAAPLRLDETVIGVLMAVTHDGPRTYTVRDIALIEGLAREAAYALHMQQLREARVHADAERLEHQELLGLLLNSTAEGIYGVDTRGICTFVNPACLRMLGYERPQDMIGKVVHALIHHTYPDGRPYPMEQCCVGLTTRAGKPAHAVDEVHWRADGSSFPVEFWSHPIYRNDRLEGAVVAFIDITERKRVESILRNSEARYRSFAEELPLGIVITQEGLIKYVNPALVGMIGYSEDELLERNFLPLVDEADRPWLLDLHRRHMSGENVESSYVIGLIRKDGEVRQWQGYTNTIEWDGKPSGMGCFTDITQIKQAETELRIAAAAFESQEGMVVTDANSVILRVNRTFTEITGYTAEEVVGQTPSMLKSDRHDQDFYRQMWETINRTGGWQGEVWDRRKNGEVYPKWLTISAVKDDDGAVTHYIGTHFDITERKQAEEKINELAFFDQLTGLPNRTLLQDRLHQTIAASSRSGSYGALLFIDLDNFKTLNDTLGHDMGDLLLKQVAQRLTLCVREGDSVARLGGDEFVVVLAGLSTGEADAATSIEAVAEKILASLRQTYQLGDVAHRSTVSIGVTLFKGDLITIEELMKQADLAMYKAKAAGRNVVRFFDPTLEVAVKERATLEKDLRRALDEKQFLLHYQAQVVGEGRLTGAEVLIRWIHPEHGMVPPAEFIPLAEETGLILPLGHWVLETACTQLAIWATRPELAHLTVAVNVSSVQFRQRDFVDQVLAVLDITGANPQRLKLELTESLLVSQVEDVIEKMFALKAKGVGFSLDDFGTGYSSLSYLKRMPLDQLKIDQSFVRDVLSDPNDAAIAITIIALAQSLGLKVIAEGVETATQRDFLVSSGCHAHQGYFFSRPLPVDGFELLAQRGLTPFEHI